MHHQSICAKKTPKNTAYLFEMGAFLLTVKSQCLKWAKVSLDLRGSMLIDRPGFTVTAAALITVID